MINMFFINIAVKEKQRERGQSWRFADGQLLLFAGWMEQVVSPGQVGDSHITTVTLWTTFKAIENVLLDFDIQPVKLNISRKYPQLLHMSVRIPQWTDRQNDSEV